MGLGAREAEVPVVRLHRTALSWGEVEAAYAYSREVGEHFQDVIEEVKVVSGGGQHVADQRQQVRLHLIGQQQQWWQQQW